MANNKRLRPLMASLKMSAYLSSAAMHRFAEMESWPCVYLGSSLMPTRSRMSLNTDL